MRSWFRYIVAFGLACSLVACGGHGDDDDGDNIVELAQANGLTALTAAVEKAGLTATLSDESASLTVFAPTNAAFDTLAVQLGFADSTALVDGLSSETLASILTYHVLPTAQDSTQLSSGPAVQPTLYEFEGSPATFTLDTTNGLGITDAALTRAQVTTADLQASNGIVHVIDKVLIPPGVLNVVQMAQVNPDTFSSLVDSLVATGLDATLSEPGPFTVFAPTNDAFAAISDLTATLTTDQLTTVLAYHVLPSQLLAAQLPFDTDLETLAGQTIRIQASPLSVIDTTTTPAPIVATDVRASNGVIHVITKVLLPAL